MALVCAKRSLRDVGSCHANLMEALSEIELRKPRCFAEIIENLSTVGMGNLSFTVMVFSAR